MNDAIHPLLAPDLSVCGLGFTQKRAPGSLAYLGQFPLGSSTHPQALHGSGCLLHSVQPGNGRALLPPVSLFLSGTVVPWPLMGLC